MKLIERLNGVIENIEVPNVFDKHGYLDEELVTMTKIVVKTEQGLIDIFVNRDNRIKEYSVNKSVVVEKYINDDSYNDYLIELRRYIKNNFSSLNELKKETIYERYKFSEEEYNKKKKILIFYGIEGLDIANNK